MKRGFWSKAMSGLNFDSTELKGLISLMPLLPFTLKSHIGTVGFETITSTGCQESRTFHVRVYRAKAKKAAI